MSVPKIFRSLSNSRLQRRVRQRIDSMTPEQRQARLQEALDRYGFTPEERARVRWPLGKPPGDEPGVK